ncbi:MAG: four helix bundle protein [Limisphaerales bacterium]
MLRSGTSIGANVEEALAGQSRRDFLSKMAVASKESRETRYWLILLQKSKLTSIELEPALSHIDELIRILTSIVKTTAENPATQNQKLKT